MIKFILSILLIISFNNSFCKQVNYVNLEKQLVKEWIKKECNIKTNLNGIVDSVYYYSKKRDIDPHLVLGLIKQESCFKTNAKSSVGAKGLMQVLEKYHQDKINTLKNKDLFHYDSNIAVGVAVLHDYLKQKNNNLTKALAKYSGNAKMYYVKVTNNKYNLKSYIYKNTKIIFRKNEKILASI